MGRRVVIDPVTRIEGRSRAVIELDEAGRVRDARVEVTALRGFEAVCAGRPLRELPALTARICGICPTAHALAAAKAGDVLLGAAPPPAARRLRRLAMLAQLVQSHALAFFYLSAPDFVLGYDAEPARRNFLVAAEVAPGLLRDGVLLRRVGQEVLARLGGRRVHAPYIVAGGVAAPLTPSDRDAIAAGLPEALAAAERTLAWWAATLPARADEAASCGAFETPFLALVGAKGELDPCEGALRLVSAAGAILEDGLDPARYQELIGERTVTWSRLKHPYWRSLGFPAGAYRVGPLARLNAVARCGTPRADRALREFRALGRGAVLSTFHAHGARLVEILFALERMDELLRDPHLLGREVLAPAGEACGEAVGACEAPRGTLFHHYRVDAGGLVTWANLLVATGQNATAMDRAVRQVAARWVDGPRITEALRSRVSAAIRAFDPCLSCSTHAVRGPEAELRLVGASGELLDEI
ncbi:Ni/Fe hydrogenase subunit alpha [Anaeromyxobacter diazotrophicus]|uniref:NADP oxidoreductase n=1 Tax=Anaeromyxobacter diazotrophicus TaxID=2590199 RepID=A0A7I9VK31_9BACT|nr:Ni/Fe hydrogenase subunit alpha [Anaeromyxobacter diazotrophicus]GEJ56756.1 NADP oxidoreductase [Anaeromyxobacter diazotrophicus]